jgi:hypothetical protein
MPAIAHNERTHAKLSPSSGGRWTTCTAYPAAVEANRYRLPKDNGSSYSREGTLAHEVCDALLMGKEPPAGATPEMIVHGKAYAAFIKSLSVGVLGSSKLEIEMEVPLWYSPEENGHVDCFLRTTNTNGDHHFHVVDYKYGAGVTVYADENIQMAIYAHAAILAKYPDAADDSLVSHHIFQPRSRKGEGEGPDSTWHVSWGQLKYFIAARVDPAVEIIENDDCAHLRVFAPSDKACQFCELRRANLCSAYTEKMLASEGFTTVTELEAGAVDIILPEASLATPDEVLVNIYRLAPRIRKWLDGVEEHLEAMANNGNPVAGTKMVAGRGSREWASEDEAAKLLKNHFSSEELYTRKLVSPAQAETKLKGETLSTKFKNRLAQLILRKEGKPVLALADDKRKAVKGADEEFEEVPAETKSYAHLLD